MSGELLRRGAIFGDVDTIKSLLEQGSNPCSTDVSQVLCDVYGVTDLILFIGSAQGAPTAAVGAVATYALTTNPGLWIQLLVVQLDRPQNDS